MIINREVLVFDDKLWNGKDVGDNAKFWKVATIIEITERYEQNGKTEPTATVQFHHDGRISKGHFVSSMKSLSEDYSIIGQIAKAFKWQLDNVPMSSGRDSYIAAIRDDIILIADVLHERFPTYDMNQFYKAAGYTGTHPVHI